MQELVKVVVDAMGGDHAPQSTVKGTVDALNKSQEISVFLVGQEDVIKKELEQYTYPKERLTIVPASEVIEMAEPPVMAIRKKKDSSIVVGMKLVKEGQADAFVSAGSTGAVLVGAEHMDFAEAGAGIHVVEAGAAQSDHFHALFVELIHHGLVQNVIYENTDAVVTLCQRYGILVQMGLKVLDGNVRTFGVAVKTDLVIGLGVKKCNFHGTSLLSYFDIIIPNTITNVNYKSVQLYR